MEEDKYNLLWQVFARDSQFIDVFSQVANEDGMPAEAVLRGTLDDAYHQLERLQPRVLFLEEQPDVPASAYAHLGSLCRTYNIGFVLIGLNPRVIQFQSQELVSGLTFKQMAAFGVMEYLSLPLTPSDIRLCLGSVISQCKVYEDEKNKLPTKTILFAGVQGGVGASSLCANYSSVLAANTKKNCLILDFDWSCSNLWINFGVEQVNTFSDLLSDPSRIDGALIESSARKLNSNLFLLSDCTSRSITNVSSLALDALLRGIDGRYSYVLVDCPIYQQDVVMPLLAYANNVFLVTDLTQASLSMLKRMLAHDNLEHMFGSMHLAMNNREPEQAYTLEDEDFINCYNFKDTLLLPYCKGSMQEAMLEGQVLAEYDDNHKYIKIIESYIQQKEMPEKENLWRKLSALIGANSD